MSKSPFNVKTLATGTLASVGLVAMTVFSEEILNGSYLAFNQISAAGIAILFFFCLVANPLLRRLSGGRCFFTGAECLVIYIMLLLSASVASVGLGSLFLPMLAAPQYYASPQNRWSELLLPHIRDWLLPDDPETVRGFFEGNGGRVPWMPWIRIFLYWMPFFAALFLAVFCLLSILRKEWVEREKLNFPLVQLPLFMTAGTESHQGVPPFFKNKLMWIGFAVPFLLASISALHHYYPILPDISLVHKFPLFRKTVSFELRMSFPVIGLCWFVPQPIAFSVWFFNILFKIASGCMRMSGITSTENLGIYGADDQIFAHLGTGAFIAFVFLGLWTARGHLKQVFRKATGKETEIDDTGEILSYKTSFWGMLAGMTIMLGWLRLSGMNVPAALLFMLFLLVFWLGVTRIVSETGLPVVISPSIAPAQVISSLGSENMTGSTLGSLGLTHIYGGELKVFPACAGMHAFKLAESVRKKGLHPLFWTAAGSLLLGFLTASFLLLKLAYTHGGINLNQWFFGAGAQVPYVYVVDHILHPASPSVHGWYLKGSGAIIMALFILARNNFLWWPLHPVGFCIGAIDWTDAICFSVFLVWLVKGMALRYGGGKFFDRAKPLFLGLVLGQYSSAVVWFIIDSLTGMKGNQIFHI